jgi:catechol 2,3-dioxygenase-like lactoylglutathione lyase family enzyme
MAKAIHTMIRAFEEKRSVDFYRRAFGLDVADRFSFDGFTLVYLRNPEADFEVELTINHDQRTPYDLGTGYGHLAFAVDDIAAEHARFEREGLKPNPVKEFHREGKLLAKFFFVAARRLQDRGVTETRPLSLTTIGRRRRRLQAVPGAADQEEETAMSEHVERSGLDRRRFLANSTAVVALMATTGTAVIHTSEAWGVETKALKPEAIRSLIKMARDIFPHDKLPDKFYAIACKTYDEKAASDPKLKSMIDTELAQLDAAAQKAHRVPYASVAWEAQRVALLKSVANGALFKKLRGDLVVSLYNQKEVWPYFGYEGESASQGGYIARGFNDINWL